MSKIVLKPDSTVPSLRLNEFQSTLVPKGTTTVDKVVHACIAYKRIFLGVKVDLPTASDIEAFLQSDYGIKTSVYVNSDLKPPFTVKLQSATSAEVRVAPRDENDMDVMPSDECGDVVHMAQHFIRAFTKNIRYVPPGPEFSLPSVVVKPTVMTPEELATYESDTMVVDNERVFRICDCDAKFLQRIKAKNPSVWTATDHAAHPNFLCLPLQNPQGVCIIVSPVYLPLTDAIGPKTQSTFEVHRLRVKGVLVSVEVFVMALITENS